MDDRNRPDASVQSGCCSTLAKDEEQHSRLEIPSVALRVIAQHALGVFVVIRRLRAARSGVPLPLTFWESVAVDPRLIAEGSRIYIPAYRNSPAHGWFLRTCLRRVYWVVQGCRRGVGASRRVITPTIAHLTIATEVLVSRS